MHARKVFFFIVKFTLSAGLVIYLVSRLNVQLPPHSLATFALLLFALAMLLCQPILMGLRWRLLLDAFGSGMATAEAIAVTWISVFANQFLPPSVGADVVRAIISKIRGWKLANVIMSIIVDRGFALLGLLILIVVFAPFLFEAEQRSVALVVAGGLIFVGLAGFAAVGFFAEGIKRAMAKWPLLARNSGLIKNLRALLLNVDVNAKVLLLSILVHLLSFAALIAISYSFNVDIGLLNLAALSSLITFAHILPISIGGWGVRDAASVVLLSSAGVDPSTALSISILLGACYAAASLPGAVFWLCGWGTRIRT